MALVGALGGFFIGLSIIFFITALLIDDEPRVIRGEEGVGGEAHE
jgi:hypothetical protein